MLVRQTPDVAGATSLVAPNYAEYGAEVHYYKKLWLSLTAGIYSARALSENTVGDVSLIEDRDKPSFLGAYRIVAQISRTKNEFLSGSIVAQKRRFFDDKSLCGRRITGQDSRHGRICPIR